MEEYRSGNKKSAEMSGYHEMFTQGKREIYRVW